MTWSFRPYALPLRTPYRWARGAQEERRGLLVRLELEGETGWGETAPPPQRPVDGPALAAEAEALVDGLDTGDGFLAALDNRQPPARLRCGIATAWLDARAKRAGVPLAESLAERAGVDARADVAVNALVGAVEAEEAARLAEEAAHAGLTTLKVKCTEDRRADAARVAAVRAGAGEEAELRLDANGAWDPAWAADHLRDLAGYGIRYVEDPVARHHLAGLRRAVDVPIALDAGLDGPGALQDAAAEGALDVAIIKPQRVGGPDHAVALAHFAHRLGVGAVVTNSLETAVGVATALHAAACLPVPVACGLATSGLLREDVAVPPRITLGRMAVPSLPGLGIGEVEA